VNAAQPNSKFIDQLIPIWQKLLGRAPIGIHDNFFELGGTGAIAHQLFSEAAQGSEQKLPPVAIFIAPTIASMAQLLEHPDAASLPAAIQLRAGTGQPPIFMTHGLGSSVLDLSSLALHIATDRPIYGLQARGTEGTVPPCESVGEMATYALEAIRRIQAHGPYTLIGYSFGGLVLMEIAHRLRAQGETVALLAMVDTYPSKRSMRALPLTRLAIALAKRRVLRQFGLLKDHYRPVPTQHVQRQKDMSYIALSRYRPRPYDGQIRFLRAADVSDFPADPVPVWKHLAKSLTVETLPGNHLEMLDVHPEALAAALTQYLKAAE
jgi:acetoacetyl-CoA synthetase